MPDSQTSKYFRTSMISFKEGSYRSISKSRAPMTTRKVPYKVNMDGVDVTPRALMEDMSTANLALNTAAMLAATSAIQNMAQFMGLPEQATEKLQPPDYSGGPSSMTKAAAAVAGLPSLAAVAKLDDLYHRRSTSVMSVLSQTPPMRAALEQPLKEQEKKPDPKAPMSIILHETDYFELFGLPSETCVPSDPNYENETKDRAFFLSSRSAIKTLADACMQTTDVWVATKKTQKSRNQKRNQGTMVTTWEIYDNEESTRYHHEDTRAAMLRRRQIRKAATISAAALHSKQSESSEDLSTELSEKMSLAPTDTQSALSQTSSYNLFTPDKKPSIKLGEHFKFAGMVIERLLQEKYAGVTQRTYCGLPPPDVLEPDIRYVYEPKILWTFESECTKDRCVTSIAWSENPKIFAVGYGRYFFTASNSPGVVQVWNIKNQNLPERTINLKSSVTTCAFSKRHPNLLAIGQTSGSVVLADISTTDCSVLYCSPETGEAIWSITWLQMESQGEDEMLLAGTQDGRILRFKRSEGFASVQMMRVGRTEGNVRGISRNSTANTPVPCSHYASVLTLCECPTEADGYLVGTDDGCIHLCSAHYLHRHLAASACHSGPVYACQVSPFVDKVYLTCGADWTVRFWAQGVYDPLLTFSSSREPVECASWSPLDSCLVASISGSEVSIWDLRRKIIAPAGTATSPTQDKFSVVTWAKDGALLVGDRAGRVHVMKVEGTPLPSFLQQKTLAFSMLKALKVTKPDLYAALKRLGKPF